MTIELAPALLSDQKVIENLWPLYVYDMSEYTGCGPSAEGRYDDGRPPLDDYWQRDDHEPYLIRCEGELAGFSMLRRYPGDAGLWDIGQFFVLRKFKRRRLGREAFRLSVSEKPGRWLTRVVLGNTGALKFWRKVIGEITNETYSLAEEIEFDAKMHFIRYEIKG